MKRGRTLIGSSAAKNQKTLLNNQAGTLFNESQSLLPTTESGWEGVMAPLSATDQAAIRQSGEGTTAASYGSAENNVGARAAASNNPVGALDLEDTLAQQKAGAVANQGLQDTLAIDQQNLQRKEAGLGGLSATESGLQGGATGLYGSATSAANAQQQGSFNWGNFLNGLLGAGATTGAAALKAGG